MTKPRDPWMIKPKRGSKPSVPDSIKAEVETKAADLIKTVLKPTHIRKPPKKVDFNYLSDIAAKWHSNCFYFISTYTCPASSALAPSFESKFARMEYLGNGKFALYFRRDNDEWVGIFDQQSVDESMKAIQDDEWFLP